MITIREERKEDVPAIRLVNEKAFGQATEADIVDQLRCHCDELLSLVAVDDGKVVGHILFSPVTVEGEGGLLCGMGLAPMAVETQQQRHGIGSALVNHGLDLLRKRGCAFVVVVGHPEFYSRIGFEPASRFGIRSQWEGMADAAFMIKVLDPEKVNAVAGTARYREEFNETA